MSDAPTTKTLMDIIQIGSGFRHEYTVIRENLRMTLDRFHKYVWVETVTPATAPEGGWTEETPDPGPTTTWDWHPNVNVLYNTEEKAILKEYYDKAKSIADYYDNFMLVNKDIVALMFNPTPKVDMLLGTVLSGVISG